MKSVLILLVGLGAGYLLSKQMQPAAVIAEDTNVSETPNPVAANACELPPSLKNLTESEVRQYLQAVTLEEKIKKADEILAKIIQALVTDFGFRIQKQEVSDSSQALASLARCQPAPTQQVTVIREMPVATPTPAAAPAARLQVNASTETEAIQILEKNPMDLKTALSSSKAISIGQANLLSGRFQGPIQFYNNRPPWTAEFSLDLRSGTPLRGRSSFVFRNQEGRETSRSRGSGSLEENFQTYNGAILISGGPYVAELYYISQLDQFSGFLAETRRGQTVRTGTIHLRRVP